MEQKKRKLCLYDDKRYLLADLPDGRPNLHTHAYGDFEMAEETHLVADQPELGAELIIRHREEHFTKKHAFVTWRFNGACAMDMEEEQPNFDVTVSSLMTTS